MTKPTATAIYARISSDQEGTAIGVTAQLADCHALAERLGWPVADEYVDNHASALSGKVRHQYQRMLTDIAEGSIDAVVVYHLDRLTRRPVELEHFLEVLDAAKVSHLQFVHGDMDIGTGDGLLVARIQAAVAANASAATSRRVKRRLDDVAAAGRPHGGSRRPFGYEDDRITIRPDEADIVCQMVARYLAGETPLSLTAWLNDTGVATVAGGLWTSQTVRMKVGSPRIAGLREHRGEVVGPAVWEPIISEADHRRVLAKMQSLAVSGRRSPRRYLLSGLLRCHRCDQLLYSAARVNTRRYVCAKSPDHPKGCGRTTVVASPVEELIADAVLLRLDTPQLAAALNGSAADDAASARLADEVARCREQFQDLADLFGDGKIGKGEWLSARKRIEGRQSLAERRLARATKNGALLGVVGQGEALRVRWADLNLVQQVAIVGAVLDHAVIGAGKHATKLDPDRVTPVWRL